MPVSPASEAPAAPFETPAASEATPTPSDAPAASEGFAGITPIRQPGRPVGYAKTGGRRKGTKNRRTIEVEEALRPLVPKAKRRLKQLIGSDDPRTAYSACMAVLSYVFGRPIDRQQVGGLPGSPPIEVSTSSNLPDDRETLRRLALILTDADDEVSAAIINSLGGNQQAPIINLDAATEPAGVIASPAAPDGATSRSTDAGDLAAGVDRSDSPIHSRKGGRAPLSASGGDGTLADADTVTPEISAKKTPEFSPKKFAPPEPKIGQVAFIDCYRIHNNGPQREGLCDSISILNADGAFMTSAVAGFAGAISWCHARGVDPNAEVEIVTPPPPPDLPQIDEIRAGQKPEIHRTRPSNE